MGLRKEPTKVVGFSRWFFPSLVMKALYRRYMPKPKNTEVNYLKSSYHRLSVFYAATMLGGFSYLIYKISTSDNRELEEIKKQSPVQRSVVGTSYQMLSSKRLEEVDKIYVRNVAWGAPAETLEVKQDIVKVVEEYEGNKRETREETRAKRADADRRRGDTPLLGG